MRRGYGDYHDNLSRESARKVLDALFLEESWELRFSHLLKMTGLAKATLSKTLNNLVENGNIQKIEILKRPSGDLTLLFLGERGGPDPQLVTKTVNRAVPVNSELLVMLRKNIEARKEMSKASYSRKGRPRKTLAALSSSRITRKYFLVGRRRGYRLIHYPGVFYSSMGGIIDNSEGSIKGIQDLLESERKDPFWRRSALRITNEL